MGMKLILHINYCYMPVSKICKALSANIKFSKVQLFKIVQLGEVLRNIPIFENILSSVPKK